jgi:hypothetical protein
MKILIDFENGMQLTLKPENVQLFDNGGKSTVVATKTDNAIIPLLFFPALLATPEELKERERRQLLGDAPVAPPPAAPVAAPPALPEGDGTV